MLTKLLCLISAVPENIVFTTREIFYLQWRRPRYELAASQVLWSDEKHYKCPDKNLTVIKCPRDHVQRSREGP